MVIGIEQIWLLRKTDETAPRIAPVPNDLSLVVEERLVGASQCHYTLTIASVRCIDRQRVRRGTIKSTCTPIPGPRGDIVSWLVEPRCACRALSRSNTRGTKSNQLPSYDRAQFHLHISEIPRAMHGNSSSWLSEDTITGTKTS